MLEICRNVVWSTFFRYFLGKNNLKFVTTKSFFYLIEKHAEKNAKSWENELKLHRQ